MRVITVAGNEFDMILWRAIASQGASGESDLEVAVRVLAKVKAVSLENPLTDEEKAQGQVPNRKLIDEESEFIFEEDEYGLVKEKLIAFIPNVALALADVLHGLLAKFKNAEKQPAAVISEDRKIGPVDG